MSYVCQIVQGDSGDVQAFKESESHNSWQVEQEGAGSMHP